MKNKNSRIATMSHLWTRKIGLLRIILISIFKVSILITIQVLENRRKTFRLINNYKYFPRMPIAHKKVIKQLLIKITKKIFRHNFKKMMEFPKNLSISPAI
jgi:hypothetical protein